MLAPKGKTFRMTSYEDANLYHNLVTGRAMSGAIHPIIQTPVFTFCKKQNTVETAIFLQSFYCFLYLFFQPLLYFIYSFYSIDSSIPIFIH